MLKQKSERSNNVSGNIIARHVIVLIASSWSAGEKQPSSPHLDSESESRWVERVFSVQLTAHRQGAADVVQGKNAVGVPWMDGWMDGERKRGLVEQTW